MSPIPTTITQSSTGLWSFDLAGRFYRVGYLSKWAAVSAARDFACNIFGRGVVFHDTPSPV